MISISALLMTANSHVSDGLGWVLWFYGGFNATYNNMSATSWWSVLLVEEIRGPGENYRPAASHWQTLSHSVVCFALVLSGIRTHNSSGDRHRLQLPYDHGHDGHCSRM